ncbi:MAG: DUF3800 domain-containing protein [Desulfoferrobacter sp.]
MSIQTFNVYCDESCHLEHDRIPVMVLGAVWCPLDKTQRIFRSIRDLKIKYGFSKDFEIKWTKVSPAKLAFYLEVIEYFFSEDDVDSLFREKYGMTFEGFEHNKVVEGKGFTWEVEPDSDEWEMAVDGIKSMNRGLKELLRESVDA